MEESFNLKHCFLFLKKAVEFYDLDKLKKILKTEDFEFAITAYSATHYTNEQYFFHFNNTFS